MSYYFNKELSTQNFDEAVKQVTSELKKEGFGILNEIDMKATLKKKLDVNFKNYKILGACNPAFAYTALQDEDKIGILLPCNVVVEQHASGIVEVAVVDPIASMAAVANEKLAKIAQDVQAKLRHVVDQLT